MRRPQPDEKPILLPAQPAPAKEIVRVEKNLNTFGFFTPSSKRLRSSSKRVTLQVRTDDGRRIQAKATIFPVGEFGLPTTADQDKYFAFQKILEQIRKKNGVITNPVRFSSAAMIDTLGMTHGGKNYREIWEWIRRMTLTGIESEGVVYFSGRKKYARDLFHVFQRSVAVGEVLEDGRIAEENYIWLSEWQLENINHRHTLPIQYDVYKTLQLHIAKALVPLLQIWFYASRAELHTEKKYSDLCSLLGLQTFSSPSRIKQQLAPSLDELKNNRFLAAWELTKTTDETDYKLCLWAGPTFVSAADVRSAENGQISTTILNSRQDEILQALVERGIREDRARQLLLDLPDDQPVLDQIEWADTEIARKERSREPIANPPGFYVYLLRSNYPVPPNFETSHKKRLREEARQQELETRARQAESELESYKRRERYDAFLTEQADAHLKTLPAAAIERRIREYMKAIQRDIPQYRWPEPALRDFAWRKLRQEVAIELDLPTFEEFLPDAANRLF